MLSNGESGPPCGVPSTLGLTNPFLEPLDGLRRDPPPNVRAIGEAESEKLPLLRLRHRTLRLIDRERERVRDESRDALHHPVTCPLAANVDVAVVGVSNEAMSPVLQLSVECVEHDVAEQW